MPTLSDIYANQKSAGWEIGHEDMVRFVTATGTWAFLFHHVMAVYLNEEHLRIHFQGVTFLIEGPKKGDLFLDFCKRSVVKVQADGTDITLVATVAREAAEEE